MKAVGKIEVKEKPSWVIYLKALGLFLITYCLIEAGRLLLIEGQESVSFIYYGVLVIVGLTLLLFSVAYERIWEKAPIRPHTL